MSKKLRSLVMCRYVECVADIPRAAAFQDTLGMRWCEHHRVRGMLLNYGCLHDFPEVHSAHYAIGHGEELWKIAAVLGKEGMLQEVSQTLGLIEEDI